ncbi:MAG: hypothetical protein PHE83_03065 [Opitutaceae bacterium]|nr:hypothetical protein [Opitutaceae bacterium]
MRTVDKPIPSTLFRALWLAAVLVVTIWLWMCWCLFPGRGWNDVRLAPTLGLSLGVPLYPGHSGPVSTWMYGPLPVLLLWPATWARDAGSALMIAGAINLMFSLGAIIVVCAFWQVSEPPQPSPATRATVALLVLAIWPGAAWQYLQADNTAVALGLLANLTLVRSRSSVGYWGAAFLATAGLFCKQTSFGVPVAQMIWLGCTRGWPEARDHVLRLLAGGAVWAALFLGRQDAPAAWFNLVVTPNSLPWTDQLGRRLWDLSPFIAIHLGVPIVTWLWLRPHRLGRDLWLPMVTWACALPTGLAAVLKIGGTLNSLQSFPLWLPPALVVVGTFAEGRKGVRWFLSTLVGVTALLCLSRILLLPSLVWRPELRLYREAEYLAKVLPGQVWFPWHPLVTVFSEHRLYNVEDGLYVRFVSGRPLTYDEARRDLPPRMSVIALPRSATDWGVALSLAPPGTQRREFGLWNLYTWPPEPAKP